MRIYRWVIFFLVFSFSCKAPECRSGGQHSGLYPFQLVDSGVAAEKISNWKQWGEEGVWLYLGRSISFLEFHLSKLKIPLFMSTGLFRYCREAWKSSHRTPYRATMSIGIWGMYLDIKVVCYLQYIYTVPVPMNPFTSKLRGFPSTTGQGHMQTEALCTGSSPQANCADWVLVPWRLVRIWIWQGICRCKEESFVVPSIHWGYMNSGILLVNFFLTTSNLNISMSFRWVTIRWVPLCHLPLHHSSTSQMDYRVSTLGRACDSNW